MKKEVSYYHLLKIALGPKLTDKILQRLTDFSNMESYPERTKKSDNSPIF